MQPFKSLRSIDFFTPNSWTFQGIYTIENVGFVFCFQRTALFFLSHSHREKFLQAIGALNVSSCDSLMNKSTQMQKKYAALCEKKRLTLLGFSSDSLSNSVFSSILLEPKWNYFIWRRVSHMLIQSLNWQKYAFLLFYLW